MADYASLEIRASLDIEKKVQVGESWKWRRYSLSFQARGGGKLSVPIARGNRRSFAVVLLIPSEGQIPSSLLRGC